MDINDLTHDPIPLMQERQLLLDSMEKRWDKYKFELERCRSEFSNEAVHDLRVATRRLLAIIRLLHMLDPRLRLKKLRRAFKSQLDILDDPRDTQVMLAEISGTIQEIPALQPFQEYLLKKEKRLLRSLGKKFKHIQSADAAKPMLRMRAAIEAESAENISSRMFQAVDNAFLITRQRFARVDPSDAATIHNVRLAFKKFHYLVEIINPLLQNFTQENLKCMKDYQSAMGAIQDIRIFLKTLKDFNSSASDPALEAALRFYEQRHADAISAFIKDGSGLNNFWRAAPNQPFPWENIK